MDRKTFDDFLAVQKFLETASPPGRVAPYSGRYFYLLTPLLSGRGLVTEAFGGQFMLRGVAELQQRPCIEGEFATFLDIAGVSHLLIDKKDPIPRRPPGTLKRSLRAGLRKRTFRRPGKSGQLLSRRLCKGISSSSTSRSRKGERQQSLGAAAQGVPRSKPARGVPCRRRPPEMGRQSYSRHQDAKASADEISRKNAQEIVIHPPAETGWLIIPEAAHPDWRATQENRILQIAEAYGAYLAIRLDGTPTGIRLSFRPPWWYAPACGQPCGLVSCGEPSPGRKIPAAARSLLRMSPRSRLPRKTSAEFKHDSADSRRKGAGNYSYVQRSLRNLDVLDKTLPRVPSSKSCR